MSRKPFARRPESFPATLRIATLIALLITLGAGACSPAPEESEPVSEPDQVYTVRGEVMGLPQGPGELRQLRVRHESVPDFVDSEGEVVGMASMTMPFPVADEVDMEGLEPGDKVEMTFEVRWDDGRPLRVVGVEELPADTALDFETQETMPGDEVMEGTGSSPP